MEDTTVNAGATLVASIVRHAMTGLSGVLAANGALTTDQQAQFVSVGSALLLYGAAQVWSLIQKRNAAKR